MSFDELYDGGLVRPLYRKYFETYSQLTAREHTRALAAARKCIHGDADFLPLVRLMTNRDYRGLVAGVRQRGRAIRLFLQDYYFGERSYERAGIFTKSQIENIVSRYPIAVEQPALRPENIQFWYAPDLVRDEAGEFKVIEDNIGFVGGMGDLEALAEASKVLGAPVHAKTHPHAFYQSMVETYKREARVRYGGGKTILLAYPKARRLNHEDDRFERILGKLGVTSVTNFRTLKVREDGLYHLGQRVGFVVVYVNSEEIDPPNKSTYRVSNFWQAVSDRKFGVSYAPGLEFVGDKNFCPRVESLVKFYLKEKCLLPSFETLSLENARSRQKLRREREKWVLKLGRGQSGESVWVGQHQTPKAWSKLLARVEKRPADFIAQQFCESSQFLGHTVDLRPLAVITPRTELISPIPWGRAAKTSKSKTNISCGGLLAPVAITPQSKG